MNDDAHTLKASACHWKVAALLGQQAPFSIYGSGNMYRSELIKLPRPGPSGLYASSEEVGPELSREISFHLHVLRTPSTSAPHHYGHGAFVEEDFHLTVESPTLFDEIILRSRHGDTLPKFVRFKVECFPAQKGSPLRWAITELSAVVPHCLLHR